MVNSMFEEMTNEEMLNTEGGVLTLGALVAGVSGCALLGAAGYKAGKWLKKQFGW